MPDFNLLEFAGLPQKKKRGRTEEIIEENRKIAEELGFQFYDGMRKHGYGGYFYDGRWKKVAEVIKQRYNLDSNSKVLIDRCHKGFLVYDLMKLIPGITVYGIHPKSYAINHAMDGFGRWAKINLITNENAKIIEEKAKQEITPYLIIGDSSDLPFKDNFFDTVISIENACSYTLDNCKRVIREIIRVTKDNGKKSYIQNDSWTNQNEKEKLMNWSFLCKTFLSVNDWKELYQKEGYDGDFGFTIIE